MKSFVLAAAAAVLVSTLDCAAAPFDPYLKGCLMMELRRMTSSYEAAPTAEKATEIKQKVEDYSLDLDDIVEHHGMTFLTER